MLGHVAFGAHLTLTLSRKLMSYIDSQQKVQLFGCPNLFNFPLLDQFSLTLLHRTEMFAKQMKLEWAGDKREQVHLFSSFEEVVGDGLITLTNCQGFPSPFQLFPHLLFAREGPSVVCLHYFQGPLLCICFLLGGFKCPEEVKECARHKPTNKSTP